MVQTSVEQEQQQLLEMLSICRSLSDALGEDAKVRLRRTCRKQLCFGSNQGTALSWGEEVRDHFCRDIVRRGEGCQSSTASVTTCAEHNSFPFCGCSVVSSAPWLEPVPTQRPLGWAGLAHTPAQVSPLSLPEAPL